MRVAARRAAAAARLVADDARLEAGMSDGAAGAALGAARLARRTAGPSSVLLRIGSDGRWSERRRRCRRAAAGAQVLPGPVLPGLVDAHSHAFQRAFAGLAERREAGREHDDFWSWRDRMYARGAAHHAGAAAAPSRRSSTSSCCAAATMLIFLNHFQFALLC